ncbi:DUF2029 domain-containing protein [Candidatus Woesebacteria bacterium]|nr:DUF2029 domain-containing protein [Candidatus Woesebacteria bacterium]
MASHPHVKKLTLLESSFIFIIAAYALWSLWRMATTTIPDFSVLFHSAVNLRSGVSLYHDASLFTGLGYPAVSLLPYMPFTILPYTMAVWIWIAVSCVAYLSVTYLSLRLTGMQSLRLWALVSAVGFLAFPTKFTFGMGQVNFIALSLLLLGTSTLRMPAVLRVVLLIISLLFKPHFVFVYVGLLFSTSRKYIVASFIGVLLLFFGVGVVTRWIPDREYLYDMVPSLLGYHGREIYYNQGIGGYVSRLFGSNSAFISYLAILAVACGSIYALAKKKLSITNVIAILLPMQVLIEPLAWQHHLVFLLPTFVILWFTATSKDAWLKVFLVICFLLVGWNIKNPLYWQGNIIGSLVLSHGFIGCFMLWYMAIRKL